MSDDFSFRARLLISKNRIWIEKFELKLLTLVRFILVGPVIGSAVTQMPSSESESLSDDESFTFLSSVSVLVTPFIVIESENTSISIFSGGADTTSFSDILNSRQKNGRWQSSVRNILKIHFRRRTENWTFISNSFFCVDLHWMERGRASLATGQFRAYYCHYPFLEGKQLLLVLQPKIYGCRTGVKSRSNNYLSPIR